MGKTGEFGEIVRPIKVVRWVRLVVRWVKLVN